uniref:PH domain-containing protein n=1 Tax=Elphidium margaritaceum TaxID=933848 RepID=A0A7S0TGV3_9EUKA|mmetsp:Transcript_205/g.314  ORF Transcript_205/g.314 Transcript_205/m.314 type:complete len:358 (+) Transcript_205:30-1103(+)
MAQSSSSIAQHQPLQPANEQPKIMIKMSAAGIAISQLHIQIEGWLLKKSRVLKKWRKRWIVLAGNKLYSYKHEKEYHAEPTEVIDVSNILYVRHEVAAAAAAADSKSPDSHPLPTKYCEFEVTLQGKLKFMFGAESNTLRDAWMAELNKLLQLNRAMVIIKEGGKHGRILSFGCKHFRRNCSYLCSCCNKWYHCSYCHDEVEAGFIASGHELERSNIAAMKCCRCGKEQALSNECCKCALKTANYYCAVCKFWDNDPSHTLYHCAKCGVCRSGHRRDYIHCDKCGVCLDKTFYRTHKCMESATKCDCPMCGDYLHMTDKPVTFWPVCYHAIHVKCMEEFLTEYTNCPICNQPWMPDR